MDPKSFIPEILATYQKHGWQLRSILLRGATRVGGEPLSPSVDPHMVREAEVDALWFSRPSHAGRTAWELRLLSDTPYALFETFEADETEEQQSEMRQEMEARLRDYVNK